MENRNIVIPDFLKKEYQEKRTEVKYDDVKKNNANRKIKKKKSEMRKKVVKTVFVASASFTLGVFSVSGFEQFMGGERIANELFEYTEGYGITGGSNGYIAVSGGKQISIDSAIMDIINDARYGGMSDVEINIGISKLYGRDLADNFVGRKSLEEKRAAKYNAFHESKVEDYNKNSGGITK